MALSGRAEWECGVYAEVSVKKRDPAAPPVDAVSVVCMTDDVLTGLDEEISVRIAAGAAAYKNDNIGTSTSTYVFPVPVRTLYRAICTVLFRCTPSPSLLNSFSNLETNFSLTTLDLGPHYLGGGVPMRAAVALLKECPNVTQAIFTYQGMGFEASHDLLEVLRTHPCLRRLDLRGNYIESMHARRMISILKENSKITEIIFDNTCRIPRTIGERLEAQLQENTQIMRNVPRLKGHLVPLAPALMAAVSRLSRQVDLV